MLVPSTTLRWHDTSPATGLGGSPCSGQPILGPGAMKALKGLYVAPFLVWKCASGGWALSAKLLFPACDRGKSMRLISKSVHGVAGVVALMILVSKRRRSPSMVEASVGAWVIWLNVITLGARFTGAEKGANGRSICHPIDLLSKPLWQSIAAE